MDKLIAQLAQAIKAVYKDPEPQNGVPTELFFENKAIRMIEKYPEKVLPTLEAYDKLVKGVELLD